MHPNKSARVTGTQCAYFPYPPAKDGSSPGQSPANNFHAIATNAPKLQGTFHKPAVNGQLSIANILTNAMLLPNFPRHSPAIQRGRQAELSFFQLDVNSKRLAIMLSSLVVMPGTENQVRVNNDGDFVVMLITDDAFAVDEHLVVLILAMLRLGSAYMVLTKAEISRNVSRWLEMKSLIDPILVITTFDPKDLPTDVKARLNLLGREHFHDYPNDDDFLRDIESDSSVTGGDINPMLASALLIRKVRSSLLLDDTTAAAMTNLISFHLLWDLAMELMLGNEKEFQIAPFRNEIPVGDRAAFVNSSVTSVSFPEPVERFVKIGQKAIRNRIAWERLEFPIKPNEKLCLTFPLNDPRSLVQMFNGLVHGKTLLLPEGPGEFSHGPFLLRQIASDTLKNVRRLEVKPEIFKEILEVAVTPKSEVQLARIKIWIVSTSSSSPLPYWLAKQFFSKVKSDQCTLVVTYGTGECLWSATWNSFTNMNALNKCSNHEKYKDSVIYAGEALTNTSVILIDDRTGLPIKTTEEGNGRICVMGSMIPTTAYCGAPFPGKTQTVLETGDTGKLFQDKFGNFQLLVNPPKPKDLMNRKVQLSGNLVDLDDISKQVQNLSVHVREAFAFLCQRGRDIPEVVVALALKDFTKFPEVKGIVVSHFQNSVWGPLKCFSVQGNKIPRMKPNPSLLADEDEIDLKSVRASYFYYLGKTHTRDWLKLMPGKQSKMALDEDDSQIETGIQTISKAVAFSLGTPLKDIIDNFEKSFWVLKGTPLRVILAIKSCLCQGKGLSVEDFMLADRISELGFRLMFAEKNQSEWNLEVQIARQAFMYSRLTQGDHSGIRQLLVRNMRAMFPNHEIADCEKYANSLIEVFDNSLSVVALSSETRQLQGVAFIYRGNLKSQGTPKALENGLELYNSMIQSCRHLTRPTESKNIAKCYLISINTQELVHPSQVIILLRDLIRESMAYAQSVACTGYLVCSQDPLVQEVCCTLLGFNVLSELQMNMYRNKKFEKPFAHLDDHQLIGVYYTPLKS